MVQPFYSLHEANSIIVSDTSISVTLVRLRRRRLSRDAEDAQVSIKRIERLGKAWCSHR